MWNRTRIWAQITTAGNLHLYVQWDIPKSSQIWSSLLGRAFPYAVGLPSVQMPAVPHPSSMTAKSTSGNVQTAPVETHSPYPTPSWFGWRYRRLEKGRDLHKLTQRVPGGGRLEPSPPVCPARAFPSAWLDCRVGCRVGPRPMPLQPGLWRDPFAQWMSIL